jgi:2-C-methyl-D-erythritol 2,4-cyclodiphosphate synthase
MTAPRVGLGFDVHPRAAERTLRLGGVRFDGERGLAGHSDGDAVCHAIVDALLGASGLGDIGERFPETDPSLSGIEGVELLRRGARLVADAGFRVSSCDTTVIAEGPSIAPRREEMRAALAAALDLEVDQLSVKATRPEGLGLSGDGVGCLAVVVLLAA